MTMQLLQEGRAARSWTKVKGGLLGRNNSKCRKRENNLLISGRPVQSQSRQRSPDKILLPSLPTLK